MSVKISATEVKKLREITGAGMMDCKNALLEAKGDFDKSVQILRKRGQKIAAKRADRKISEGLAITKINNSNTYGVAIVLACETDFVAKNESFKQLASDFVDIAIKCKTKDELLAANFGSISVAEKLIEQTGIIGEKIDITSFKTIEAPYVGAYTHAGKIAAVVGISETVDKAEVLTKDLAMQVASMGAVKLSYKDFDYEYVNSETQVRIAAVIKDNEELARLGKSLKNIPKFVSRQQLTDSVIAEAEKEIKNQLKTEGKPEKIWDKILPGKIERFIVDNTSLDQEQALLDQKFIKDEKKSVAQYVKNYGNVEVKNFIRVALG
ncbi:MAG: translation elongation factor Ts [Tenacibaculum sp.]